MRISILAILVLAALVKITPDIRQPYALTHQERINRMMRPHNWRLLDIGFRDVAEATCVVTWGTIKRNGNGGISVDGFYFNTNLSPTGMEVAPGFTLCGPDAVIHVEGNETAQFLITNNIIDGTGKLP